jgi:hypothetical protein
VPRIERLCLAGTSMTTPILGEMLLSMRQMEQKLKKKRKQTKFTESGLLELDLSNCKQLTDDALKHIAKCVPRLRVLKLHGVFPLSDKGLGYIALGCAELHTLDVGLIKHVTDVSLVPFLQLHKQLRSLNVGGCTRLTDAAVHAIGDNCAGLRVLSLAGLDKVTPAAFEHCVLKLRSLRALNLNACRIVPSLFCALEKCAQLRHLEVGF